MKIRRTLLSLSAIILLSLTFYGQNNNTVKDYMNVPGPVVLDKKSYKLNWSSHPSANYYKQEYIPAGEAADKFKSMVMLEVLIGNTNMKDLVAAKISELKKMKETNPVINYEAFDNSKSGEYMLDFLLTANAQDGTISIAERNVYRYTSFTDKSGVKGVLLFAVSTRSYGNDVTAFLTSLKTTKKDLVNQVAQFKIPAVTLVK